MSTHQCECRSVLGIQNILGPACEVSAASATCHGYVVRCRASLSHINKRYYVMLSDGVMERNVNVAYYTIYAIGK
jgi:hypothetical protein